MKTLSVALMAAVLFALAVPAAAQEGEEISDAQIRQLIVQASLRSYSGSCPCPYNTDRAGRSCGRRSAYSRPGGASPMCYASDVPDARVRAYRDRLQAQADESESETREGGVRAP